MSLIQSLETEAEKVFHDAETVARDIDGAALAEARRLLADAKTAEARIAPVVSSFEAEIAARLKQLLVSIEPQVMAELEAALQGEMSKLLASLLALFGLSA